MAATRVKILEAISDVTREQWNAALAPDAPPFARWEWIEAMEASGSATRRTGWQPHHLTLWRGDRLIAHAPAWRKFHSMGEYVYDFAWASAAAEVGVEYYPKLLVGVPLSPITAVRFSVAAGEDLEGARRALVDAALESAREIGCSGVHVIFPPETEAKALESLGLSHRVGMQYQWTNPGYATYDEYLARFGAKRRHQLRRERGEAAKQGIGIRTVTRPEIGPEHAELAWKFYEATNRKNAWGRIQLNRDFFRRAFEAIPEIEMVLAERNGRAIAGAFNLGTAQRLYGRYWGAFEEVPFLHFHVCLYHSIDDCIRLKRKVFEPGAGGEHKIPRGFAPSAIHSAHAIFDRRLDRAIRDFVKREADSLERYLMHAEQIAGMKPWIGMDEE